MPFGLGRSEQLAGFAFTVTNVAYKLDEVFKNRPTPMTVTAYSPSSTNWKQYLELQHKPAFPTEFSEAEQVEPKHGQTKYIVVGVIPSKDISEEELRGNKSRRPVGTTLPENVIEPEEGILPLRLVAPVTSNAPRGGLKLYALTTVNPHSKLCSAHEVSRDNVFYFAEYRHLATQAVERRREWNMKILAVSVEAGKNRLPFGVRPASKPPVAPPLNDLLHRVSLYLESMIGDTPNTKPWEHLKPILDKAVADHDPVPSLMEAFLNGKSPTTLDHNSAKELCEVISNIFGQVCRKFPLKTSWLSGRAW